jgi:hypothetical protein
MRNRESFGDHFPTSRARPSHKPSSRGPFVPHTRKRHQQQRNDEEKKKTESRKNAQRRKNHRQQMDQPIYSFLAVGPTPQGALQATLNNSSCISAIQGIWCLACCDWLRGVGSSAWGPWNSAVAVLGKRGFGDGIIADFLVSLVWFVGTGELTVVHGGMGCGAWKWWLVMHAWCGGGSSCGGGWAGHVRGTFGVGMGKGPGLKGDLIA